ncbi:MAG: DEAD/DEAH box helicase [Thermodesulfovibrionia bacterium]|nr:DEAD/DEAH box helicase [Thermodesulfovibrionia bacterium]
MYERFYEFGLTDEVLNSLSSMGFEEPTQIQKIAIPPVMRGQDIIGVAQSGTGKTAAFGIPIVEKDMRGKSKKPCALVLVPTRELAMQVAQEMNRIGKNKAFVSIPIYGGQSIERQIKSLKKGIDVVVGTPGRIIDHIKRRTLILSEVSTVVLDEADEMLNMGFIEDMQTILREIPKGRQTLLFSATMPEQIVRISKKYMVAPKKVCVDTKEIVVAKIKQVFYEVRENDKTKALTRILDVQDPALTLIFCHTKREVDELSGKLQQMGYEAGAIHGDFTQSFRDEMMRKFKSGEIDILVATDVAARGLDINDVTHVINFSIPQNPDAYVHRIGRTGRAGKSGIAITFVTPREYSQLRFIEKTARTKIKKGTLPSKTEVQEAKERELAEDLESIIEKGKHKTFYPFVESLLTKFAPEEVAAAALKLVSGDMEIEHIEETGAVRYSNRADMRRLFLTIGRKDKIRVGDMVRTISDKSGIPGRNIGNIALFDKYSFVEVPADLAEQVIGSINDMIIGGKKVKVQTARKRKHA